MIEYCRLCAELKDSFEIVASINDVEKLMERKLRVCCQWTNQNVEQRLPHTVCTSCLDRLDKCWLFAQSVQLAQQKLSEIFGKHFMRMNFAPFLERKKKSIHYFPLHVENQTKMKMETTPLAIEHVFTVCESTERENNFPSISNVQNAEQNLDPETFTHQQQECAEFIETESMPIDCKSSAGDFSGSDSIDDIYAGDNDFDVDESSHQTENLPHSVKDEHKPSQIIIKAKNKAKVKKIDTKQPTKSKPSKKQYPCTMCDRVFNFPANLKKHEHSHNATRPYNCPLCSKS